MSTPTSQQQQLSQEQIDELLLCARYGEAEDLEQIQQFVAEFGAQALTRVIDAQSGNTLLHYSGANGHDAIVSYLLPLLPIPFLSSPNASLSTPLHWIALNYHLSTLQLLCPLLPRPSFDLKNGKGKTALGEAEENCESFIVEEKDQETPRGKERIRREKVVGYLLECMGLGIEKNKKPKEGKQEEENEEVKVTAEEGQEPVVEDEATMERLTKEAEKIQLARQQKNEE